MFELIAVTFYRLIHIVATHAKRYILRSETDEF